MRALRRGLKSIRYNRKRSVLFVLIFLVITMLLAGVVSLYRNVDMSIAQMEERIGAELVVRKADSWPYSYYLENYFSLEDAEQLLEIEGIDGLKYMTMSNVKGVNVQPVYEYYLGMLKGRYGEISDNEYWRERYGEVLDDVMTAGAITLIGVENLEDCWEFEKWDGRVVEGEGFTSADSDSAVAVVGIRFFEDNFLEIGQEITFYDPWEEDRTITLTVIGVHSGDSDLDEVAASPMNYIYIPAKQGLDFAQGKVMQVQYHTTIPGQTRILKGEIKKQIEDIFGEEFTVYEKKMLYLMAAYPLNGIKNVCTYMLGVTVAILILTLILLASRFLLERKKEIGIWLSMGERKGLIVLQLVEELLLPTLTGVFTGGVLLKLFEKQAGNIIARLLPSFEGIIFRADMDLIGMTAFFTMMLAVAVIMTTAVFLTGKHPRQLI